MGRTKNRGKNQTKGTRDKGQCNQQVFGQANVNRKVKDRLFRLVFSDKKDLLELYNAVNNSHYTNPEELEITTLEDVVYMSIKNDISFIVDDILNLYEHQSTLNPNMPLRGLLYICNVYRGFLGQNADIYGSSIIHLPLPQYVVFYNGTTEEPETTELSIQEAFDSEKTEESCLDFRAKMLNINYGHNRELMSRCQKLREYAIFIAAIRENIGEGMTLRTAIDRAVDRCITEGILTEILSKNRAEVESMLLTEYNEQNHIDNEKKVSKAEGKAEALLEFLEEYGTIPEALRQRILRESNLDTLKGWIKLAIRSENLAEFEDKMK